MEKCHTTYRAATLQAWPLGVVICLTSVKQIRHGHVEPEIDKSLGPSSRRCELMTDATAAYELIRTVRYALITRSWVVFFDPSEKYFSADHHTYDYNSQSHIDSMR